MHAACLSSDPVAKYQKLSGSTCIGVAYRCVISLSPSMHVGELTNFLALHIQIIVVDPTEAHV